MCCSTRTLRKNFEVQADFQPGNRKYILLIEIHVNNTIYNSFDTSSHTGKILGHHVWLLNPPIDSLAFFVCGVSYVSAAIEVFVPTTITYHCQQIEWRVAANSFCSSRKTFKLQPNKTPKNFIGSGPNPRRMTTLQRQDTTQWHPQPQKGSKFKDCCCAYWRALRILSLANRK